MRVLYLFCPIKRLRRCVCVSKYLFYHKGSDFGRGDRVRPGALHSAARQRCCLWRPAPYQLPRSSFPNRKRVFDSVKKKTAGEGLAPPAPVRPPHTDFAKRARYKIRKKPVIPSQCAHWRGNPYPFFMENGLPRLLTEPRNDKLRYFYNARGRIYLPRLRPRLRSL